MARGLEDRYASATEALAALDEIAKSAVPDVIEEQVTMRERHRVTMPALERVVVEPPPPSRRRWGAVLAAVAAVLAGFSMTRC